MAGIAIAPSLESPSIENQNSKRRFNISITVSPFLIPRRAKKDAVISENFLKSANVKSKRLPSSFVQSIAFFFGSFSAQASTTSYAKLKLFGTATS